MFGVVAVILVTLLITYPSHVAREAVSARLKRRYMLAWIFGKLHASASTVHLLITRSHTTGTEQLSLYHFGFSPVNIATELRVQSVLTKLSQLQSLPVESTESFAVLKSASPSGRFHDLGFQSEEPARDFRGAGHLGLVLLNHFAQQQNCSSIILESGSVSLNEESAIDVAKPWYPMALVSIRLSLKLYEILRSERLLVLHLLHASDIWNDTEEDAWMLSLKSIHTQLLDKFHKQWIDARLNGHINNYFDTEPLLKTFENSLPSQIYLLCSVIKQIQ